MLYITTGLAFMLLRGAFLGVWNLLAISSRHASNSISTGWVQAHGHAQIFGWIGTFALRISPRVASLLKPTSRLFITSSGSTKHRVGQRKIISVKPASLQKKERTQSINIEDGESRDLQNAFRREERLKFVPKLTFRFVADPSEGPNGGGQSKSTDGQHGNMVDLIRSNSGLFCISDGGMRRAFEASAN